MERTLNQPPRRIGGVALAAAALCLLPALCGCRVHGGYTESILVTLKPAPAEPVRVFALLSTSQTDSDFATGRVVDVTVYQQEVADQQTLVLDVPRRYRPLISSSRDPFREEVFIFASGLSDALPRYAMGRVPLAGENSRDALVTLVVQDRDGLRQSRQSDLALVAPQIDLLVNQRLIDRDEFRFCTMLLSRWVAWHNVHPELKGSASCQAQESLARAIAHRVQDEGSP
ncbi:MAG: hypothetical protein BIFFINMI_04382 [Phycisphaerae bacterium]|nr:hypothetical protein [Phycisphaerae bacterium]